MYTIKYVYHDYLIYCIQDNKYQINFHFYANLIRDYCHPLIPSSLSLVDVSLAGLR